MRLPYIVITCARIDSIKRVCSEPPCSPGVFSDLLSIHDSSMIIFFLMLETICKNNEVITTRVERNEQKTAEKWKVC